MDEFPECPYCSSRESCLIDDTHSDYERWVCDECGYDWWAVAA